MCFKQGYVLLSALFSLYTEQIRRYIEQTPDEVKGAHYINSMRYAGGTVFTAASHKEL